MMPFFMQYSAKLLKKPDQCRAVYACSHLFWVDDQENMKDGERCVTIHLTNQAGLWLCSFICTSPL